MKRCFPLALLLLGCGSTDPTPSTDLDPSEINFSVRVESNGSLVVAHAFARDPDYTSITFTDPDRLLLAAGGAELPFTWLDTEYIGALPTSEADLSMILARDGGSRIVSAIPLPPSFVLLAPPAPASRSSAMTLTWGSGGAGFDVQIEVESPCFPSSSRKLTGDSGAHSIQPAELPEVLGDCEIEVRVTRSWRRDLSSELASEYPATLSQIRTTRFITTP